ncbi:MAG: PBSX family phage terminase large subunit [Proteobacteria bacterium]|nr:PBSX family phage terminase large subunit [Pseudomonadota bacterium]
MTRLQVPVARVFAPLLAKSRYKGARGGRGSAKSHFFADLLVTRAVGIETRAVCVREVQKSIARSVKQLIEDKIRGRGLAHFFRILETHIEVVAGPGKGGRIDFQGMQNHTADSIKSLEGYDIAWVEEAQSLSQRSLDLLRPTIRKAGSEIWASWNPESPDDPIEQLLCGANPPSGTIVVTANYVDNPWFPEELREEMEVDRLRDPDKFAHIWLGQYLKRTQALVFNNWSTQAFDTPQGAFRRFGADWGFAQDPTVLVSAFVGRWVDGKAVADPNGRVLFVDHEASAVGCEIDHTPALFDKVPEARQWTITADSARQETISYMRRQGFKIIPAIKGPGSVEDGIEFLKSFDIVVHPRCERTAQELETYSFKVDPDTDEILPVLEDKNNHVIDALRYALEALRRVRAPVAPPPSRNPPDLWGRRREEESWKTA